MAVSILSSLIFLPLLGVALILLFARGNEEGAALARWVALGISGVTFIASLLLWWRFDITTDQFQFCFSILILGMVILGGLGSIWGVVLGVITLTTINFYLIPDVINTVPGDLGLDFDTSQITFAIYGFLLVIMMILRPEGLLPERRRKAELHEAEGEDSIAATMVTP